MLWSVQFVEEHDEDAVVGHLVVVHLSRLVVLQQNSDNNSKHLNQFKFVITSC